MRFYDLIEKKKHGISLTEDEIYSAVRSYTDGDVPDYQMSALLMAIYFKGMTDKETLALTRAIVDSGDTIDLREFGTRTVDKHSSGGVGDKTTLIISPIVASLGGVIAKMSGRGLGHTGGTVDKLESVPGYKTNITPEEFRRQVKDIGVAVVGQSGELAPADKKLYALRDVTATVDSIPLIASSIMGKKLASGAESIVLDVKYGSGAFMKTKEDALLLAEKMISIGKGFGRQMAAVISSMEEPLGYAVGNTLEVEEALEVLSGKGEEELTALCIRLATLMSALSLGIDEKEAEKKVRESVRCGAAVEKFREWISRQGGDPRIAEDPSLLGRAEYSQAVTSDRDGFLSRTDAEKVGVCAMMLGAGRAKKEDEIDPLAGVVLKAKVGDAVKKGQPLAILCSSYEEKLADAAALIRSAFEIDKSPGLKDPVIYKVLI
jgi:pyrimidine-nucleoside phosphorylase